MNIAHKISHEKKQKGSGGGGLGGESTAKNILKVVPRVWSLDQEYSISWGTCYKRKFSGPISDLQNQKPWRYGPGFCVSTSPPDNFMHAET